MTNKEAYQQVIDIISDQSLTATEVRQAVGDVFVVTGLPEVYGALLDLWCKT